MTRFFNAPRSQVFEAWTRAEHLEKWFGPKGFTITDGECDPRPGGIFRLCMRSPAGEAYWVRGVYTEIAAPERLVIACIADDDKGIARLEEIIQVAFEEHNGGTRLRLNATARGMDAVAATMLAGMHKGWAQTVDRLGALLNPKRQKEM